MTKAQNSDELIDSVIQMFNYYVRKTMEIAKEEDKPIIYSKMISDRLLAFYFIAIDGILGKYGIRNAEELTNALGNMFHSCLGMSESPDRNS